MAKYIDADALDELVVITINNKPVVPYSRIKEIKGEDVVPVKHARFIFDKTNLRFLCTNCETESPPFCTAETVKTFNYCPNCGAKMDKVTE